MNQQNNVGNFVYEFENSLQYFIKGYGTSNFTNGWKLSIQGKTAEDAHYLYNNLIDLLIATNSNFKFATKKLLTCHREEQRTKLLTIYIPNNVEPKSFAELVYLNIMDYKGGDDIPVKRSYEHYKNAIYYRNDRDQYGEYIEA